MPNDRLTDTQDYSDWRDEAMKEEIEVESDDDIAKAFDEGKSSSVVARATVVSMLLGKAVDIIPPIKLLVQSGAQASIAQKISRRKVKVQTKSGEVEMREYLGVGNENEDSKDKSYIRFDDVKHLEMAEHYLSDVVPGYIRPRLLEIHSHGGDVKANADLLIRKIKAMVSELE